MSNAQSCINCRYVFAVVNPGNPKAQQLVCRRRPPQVCLLVTQGFATKENPAGLAQIPQGIPAPVSPEWWCGEFEPANSGAVS